MSEKPVLIAMLKPSLDDILHVPVPNGYTMRSYMQCDREMWIELYHSLDPYYNVTAKDFDESFGSDNVLLARSMFFLCHNGKEIGTVTSWPEDDIYGKKTGRLHWIGVSPQHRGSHLGAALVSFILNEMRLEGCEQCVLGTNEKRLEALNMYFKFGFLPIVYTDKYSPLDAQKESWLRVKQNISYKYKDLISF